MQKARFAFALQAYFGRARPTWGIWDAVRGRYRHATRCLRATFAMLNIADDSGRIIYALARVRN